MNPTESINPENLETYIGLIQQMTASYPRFPDGRINYKNARICFVISCVVIHENYALLARRSSNVTTYPGTLSGISGYIDRTDVSLEDTTKNELKEELGLAPHYIDTIKTSRPFIQVDDTVKREWHVFAVLVELNEQFLPQINWENSSVAWYNLNKIPSMSLLPSFTETLRIALAMRM